MNLLGVLLCSAGALLVALRAPCDQPCCRARSSLLREIRALTAKEF